MNKKEAADFLASIFLKIQERQLRSAATKGRSQGFHHGEYWFGPSLTDPGTRTHCPAAAIFNLKPDFSKNGWWGRVEQTEHRWRSKLLQQASNSC